MNQEDLEKMLRKHKEDIESTVQEYFDNIQAIKGEQHMEAVKFITGVSHTAKMISMATQWAPPHIRQAVGMQFAQVASGGATLIMKYNNFSDEDVKEVLEISDRISNTIDSQMELLSAALKKARGDDDD